MHIHIAFFWLKEGISSEDKGRFEDGLSDLSGDPNVHRKHIGKPALTDRQVIDSSYDYAISFAFDDLASHDNYQAGHAHLGFLDECGHMWHKVQVFDLEEISIAGE